MTWLVIVPALMWLGWLGRRRQQPAAPPPPDERIVEARIRIGAHEPRMGHPRHRRPQSRRGFECIEIVPEQK